MEIRVQATHELFVAPEIARAHIAAQAEGGSSEAVFRTVSDEAGQVQAALNRLRDEGAVTEVVVRPISTSSWRPVSGGKQRPPIYRAYAALRADFTDFSALAGLAAQFGANESVEFSRVEWRLTEATRLRLESHCLTEAVGRARERALVMARAAGFDGVTFVHVADPGLLGDRTSAETFAVAAPKGAMMRSAMAGDELAGIELQPEDLVVAVQVQARFVTE